MATLKELLVIKEDLKKEVTSTNSTTRICDMLSEIENLVAKLSREEFVESKIGGVVKKLSDSHKGEKPGNVALELMEKWKVAFSKPTTPRESANTSTSSSSSSKNESSKTTSSQKVQLPQDKKRQRTCTLIEEIFVSHKTPEILAKITQLCVEIEDALYKLGQEMYISKYRLIKTSLPKNESLRLRLLSGDLKPSELVNFSSKDFISQEEKQAMMKELEEVNEARRSDWMDANREEFVKTAGVKVEVGMFKCGKCQSTKTTHYQKQTRSAELVFNQSFNV